MGSSTSVDFEGIISSLQNDVVDIKKQAEVVHRYFVSVEDPREAVVQLEKQLGKVTAELTKTKEDLTKKTNELIRAEEELTRKNKGEMAVSCERQERKINDYCKIEIIHLSWNCETKMYAKQLFTTLYVQIEQIHRPWLFNF